MQAGQSVKINTGAKTPLNGEDYWETAKFLGWWNQADQICEVQIGEPEKVGYRVIHIHRHFVREFRQLEIDENGECPAINEMVQRDIPKISEFAFAWWEKWKTWPLWQGCWFYPTT